jgi:hypothetical protein
MKSYNDVKGPRVATITVASGISEYILRVQELGVVEGTSGAVELHPSLKPVMEALHHVLAGGEVEVKVVHRGNPDIVLELNRRAEQSIQEANAINAAAGFYLTAMV